MNDLSTMSIPDIRTYVHTEEGQDTITAFADRLRAEVGSKVAYLATVLEAEKEINGLTIGNILLQLRTIFDRFYATMPAGHDKGHALRDLLSTLALSLDPFVTKGYKSDVWAGIIAGVWHDLGNSFMIRYQDTAQRAGHGEAWAWAMYQLSGSVLPEHLRLLAAYAILVHVHYLKPVKVMNPEGFVRLPYWDNLEFESDPDEYPNTKRWGFAIKIARAADRLDNNGVTLVIREWLAKADATESGGGADITSDQWYDANKENLQASFLPKVRMVQVGTNSDGSSKLAPTVLQHGMNYMRSNFGLTPYSKFDFHIPTLVELMLEKSHQTMTLRDILTGANDSDMRVPGESLEPILRMVSLSSDESFARSWNVLRIVWENVPNADKIKWEFGLAYIDKSYRSWINLLGQKASKNPEFIPIVEHALKELLG